jgi:hypothetical protein
LIYNISHHDNSLCFNCIVKSGVEIDGVVGGAGDSRLLARDCTLVSLNYAVPFGNTEPNQIDTITRFSFEHSLPTRILLSKALHCSNIWHLGAPSYFRSNPTLPDLRAVCPHRLANTGPVLEHG